MVAGNCSLKELYTAEPSLQPLRSVFVVLYAFLMCVTVLPTCMSVYMCAWSLQRPQGIRPLGTGV